MIGRVQIHSLERLSLERLCLTLPFLCISESCIETKSKLNFYFETFLRCLKRFYEGLYDLHKTFCGTTKKCENKNLT